MEYWEWGRLVSKEASHLIEKWRLFKKFCFQERFTPLEIRVVATQGRGGHWTPLNYSRLLHCCRTAGETILTGKISFPIGRPPAHHSGRSGITVFG